MTLLARYLRHGLHAGSVSLTAQSNVEKLCEMAEKQCVDTILFDQNSEKDYGHKRVLSDRSAVRPGGLFRSVGRLQGAGGAYLPDQGTKPEAARHGAL